MPSNALAERPLGDMTAVLSAPDRTQTGLSGLLLTLKGSDGAPVSGADVHAKTSMPQHNMSGPDMVAQQRGPGQYWLPGNLMQGQWRIDLSVKEQNGKKDSGTFDVRVP